MKVIIRESASAWPTDEEIAGPRVDFRLPAVCLGLLLLLLLNPFLPCKAISQTELGSEGDLTVLGTGGTLLDPNAEIKGFTVFGSTQAGYSGAVAGDGNVVVNGVLSVSSGAYFVGNSTFTGANKIFITDGAAGQILIKDSAGYLQWISSGAIGDNLGNHTAAQALNLNNNQIENVSSMTIIAPETLPASLWVSTSATTPHLYVSTAGNVGIGTRSPKSILHLSGLNPILSIQQTASAIGNGVIRWSGSDGVGQAFIGSNVLVTDSGNLEFGTGIGTTNMTLTSSGNVGIGQTVPDGKLTALSGITVADAAYNGQGASILASYSGGAAIDSLGNGIVFAQQYSTSDPASQVRTGAIFGYKGQADGSFGGGLRFMVQPAGANPMVNAMTIDKAANVGIGTASPQAKLDVTAYQGGTYTMYVSTTATTGQYSIAVSSAGVTNIKNLAIENRTSDPAAPVTGQIWLRTN